jgi:hypothetical protein
MKTKTSSLLAAAALTLFAAPAFAATADFHWSRSIGSAHTVEIRNIIGAIHAEASNDGTVEVTAIRSSKKHDPESVKINVFEVDGRLTFCSLYPGRPGSPPNTCDERGNHSHSSSDSDVEVSYRVKVPAGVTLEARTVNGDIEATGMLGPVDARTVNGEIKVGTTSWAQASTVNGGVAVAMAGHGWPDGLDFRTVNGSIVLEMADAPNAALRAETMNGAIDSEFPLTVHGKFRRNKVTATLGSGGPELALATLNGSIELRRAR